MRSFGEASLYSSRLIRSGKYTEEELAAMNTEKRVRIEELRSELESYRQRFYAQFKKPDPEAPYEKRPKPGSRVVRRKQYSKMREKLRLQTKEI